MAKDPTAVRLLDDSIKDWDKWQDDHKRYCRVVECFLHDEDWSPEQELEIGRRRNEVKQEFSRKESIKYHYDFTLDGVPVDADSAFSEPGMSEEFKKWERDTPSYFLELLRRQIEKKTTKDLLDEAEGRVQKVYSSNRDVINYERITQ